jgi:hypothetical protein
MNPTLDSTQQRSGVPTPPSATSNHALYVIPRKPGDGFQANIRGHVLDLADPSSGNEPAPTPQDLFVVAMASEIAWSARTFLRTYGLPDDVNVCAHWRTRDDLPHPGDIDLIVMVSRRAEAMSAELVGVLENNLEVRSRTGPIVHISLEGVER